MDNEEGVQEQMKADLSALKDQMASISEVMLKLQKTIEDKATATASSTVREAEPVLQPALNPGLDRNTAVFGRRYSPQAYPYGLPPDFTPRGTPEDLSQAPTFEGQLPPYEDYPGASAQRKAPAAPRPVNNTAPGATYKYAQHPKDNFPPIPMAYAELWPSLLENHLVVAIPGKVLQPPYPKWYDPGAKCVYHSGVSGHNIDSCMPFKYKVQHLISAGWLAFKEEGPNVKTNPLASHGGASVNVIEEDGPSRTKRLGDVATSRHFIYQSLQAACMVSRGGGERDECLFHLGESHDMETCPAVEELLQWLMDCGHLEVSIGGREEPQICTQSEEKKVPLTPKALVICFTRKGTGSTPIYPRAAPKPTPFAYQSNKAVPWKYTPPASSERVATEVDSLSAKVTNITGLSGVTRSGRVFASPHPVELPSKGKAPMVQEPADIATPSKEVDPSVGRGVEKKEGLRGKTVTLEEAHEFLRLIQQSEFKVVEQLNKTPARISLLELLINSEPHRALLMKVLNDAHDCLGKADVVDIKGNPYKYGLGYEPGMPGRRNVPSRFRADRVWPGRISQCFTSAGMVSEEEVAVIEEEFPQDPPCFVQPCHPDSQVGNWHVISQSEVYTADSIFDRCFTRPSTFFIQIYICVAFVFSPAFPNSSLRFTKSFQTLCFSMATSPKETSAPGSPSAPSNQERPEFNIQPIQVIPGQAPVPEKLVPKRQQGVKISENPSPATSPREVDPEMDKKIRSIVSNILKNAAVPDADVPTSSTPNAEALPSPSEEESTEEEDQASEETPAPRAPEPAPGDLIDLEEVESDEEPIANRLAPGIAERLQNRKGKTPLKRSGRIKTMAQKKSTPITPATSRRSKVAIPSKKRKEISFSSSDSDDDVELDVSTSKRAKKSGRKVPGNVPDAPLDNISFHSIGNVEKWKYVYQRRLAVERELGRDALDCKETMELIKAAGLLKTVTKLGDCYEGLVREFIVNIPSDITNRKSDEYQKVFVRGKCVRFSPAVINKYLGRPTNGVIDIAVSEHQIAKEITAKRVQHWPKKGKLSAGKLSVKYAILHRIGAANWVPTSHTSTVATGLGKFLYAVGTKSKFNFGNYIFDQTVKHSESFAVKLPIAFPTVLCGIMLSQHPNMLNHIDSVMKRESPLSLHYKLFEGTHVPDIVSTSGKAAASGAVSKDALIAELKDTCKVLEATIKATTEKKMELERLIERLTDSGIDDGEAAEDKAAEGTSSAPEYNSHRFRSTEHQQRFEAIKGWSFLRERRVQLRDDEYTDFQEEIVRRRWASMVTPMAKFDPDIVLKFYANAWPTEEGVSDMRSWVRGQWIPFDADAIDQLLGYPLVLEEGQECEYGQRRNRSDGFDDEAIAQLLCIPGQDFAQTAVGRRVRIMRTNMTTLTQIWMTLLLSNILPRDHNSDLPLPKCQLVYAILTRMSIHVAQLIADVIYIFRQVQGDAPQAVDAPPPHQAGPAGLFDTEQYLQHLVRQQAANHRAHVQTHDCLYQMSLSLQSQGFTSFPCPTPDQFRAEVAWPEDWPEAQAGEAPAEAPDEADEAREDEEMTDLLDFLGGSGAT
ncbi:hypothetical protein GmHk_02G005020 [Glycine max]|nr:hypothetical protein GmHk_02G005020 [Glycine max]